MTLTFIRRGWRDRIRRLPEAKHECGVWVRRPRKIGKLACVVCGRP